LVGVIDVLGFNSKPPDMLAFPFLFIVLLLGFSSKTPDMFAIDPKNKA